jgi:type IV secretion system protein VirD4
VSLLDRWRLWRAKRYYSQPIHPPAKRPPTFWERLAQHPDALGMLVGARANAPFRYSTNLGISPYDGSWAVADPETHTLVLGPPRSAAGKTSGYMIPVTLTQGGPVVVSSTKFDIARNTAMGRSRLGTVWHYDPTGAPPPPGFKELKWSPVLTAKDWNAAREIGSQMAAAADSTVNAGNTPKSDSGHFFEVRSGDLLASLLHYAALTGKEIDFVVSRVSSQLLSEEQHKRDRPGRVEDGPDFIAIVNELDKLGATEAADKLDGIIWSHDRTRSDIFSTADTALRGYQGTALLAATNQNFFPEKFILGEPELPSDLYMDYPEGAPRIVQHTPPPRIPGRYDTVYITVPADKQSLYAPLVVGLLSAIKREVYLKHQEEERQGKTGTRQPVTFVLDEMYGSPLPDLPLLLSDGGGQGLLICGALQDLSQATARWGEVGQGFLTLWQNVLVLPGIRDRATLELLSLLIGNEQRAYWTQSWSEQAMYSPSGQYQREWTQGRSEQVERTPRLPPDEIYRGNPNDPSEVLHFSPNGGWGHIRLMKYWSGQPWPGILLQSTDRVLRGVNMEEELGRYAENWALPLPNLARGGDLSALRATGGEDMARWYWHLQQRWESKQPPTAPGPPESGPPESEPPDSPKSPGSPDPVLVPA